MIEHRAIVDTQGNIIERCVQYENNNLINFVLEDGENIVPIIRGNFVRAKWDFDNEIWVEGATEEEIKAWQEENKVVQKPSTQDVLNAKLIADNAKLLKENKEQKKLNADLLLKIAMLGGKANV